MSKKEEQLRREGMRFCERFLDQHDNDVNALRAEIKKRGAHNIPLRISPSELEEFCMRTKTICLDTVLCASLYVLHGEFGFGMTRLDRFKAAFNDLCQYMVDDYTTWRAVQDALVDETGIDCVIRFGDELKARSVPYEQEPIGSVPYFPEDE